MIEWIRTSRLSRKNSLSALANRGSHGGQAVQVQGSGFRVQVSGFRVQIPGFRVQPRENATMPVTCLHNRSHRDVNLCDIVF